MEVADAVGRVKQFGALHALGDFSLLAINRFAFFKILKCVKIEKPESEFLNCDARFRSGFLDRATLAGFANQPEYELSEQFLDKALAKGDECYGFLDGNALASYGWYSNKPTKLEERGLIFNFDPSYIYMYKGFTHASYRGKRLHAVGMTLALQEYLARGYRGFVSNVEWNNFASLRSCYRMGYQDIGNIYALRANGHYFLHAARTCKPYGVRLEREKSHAPLRRRLPAL